MEDYIKDKAVIRALNYDLDDSKLKKFYPNPKSYKNAWKKIKDFLIERGFIDRQYSGVVSKEPLTMLQINGIIDDLNMTFQWLAPCIRVFDVTEVGETYSLTDRFVNLHENDIDKTKTENETFAENILEDVDNLLNKYNSIDIPDFDYQNEIIQSKEL